MLEEAKEKSRQSDMRKNEKKKNAIVNKDKAHGMMKTTDRLKKKCGAFKAG